MALTFPHLPTRGTGDSTKNFEALQKWLRSSPGPWKKGTVFNAKLEETTTVEVRKEEGGTVARLKGFFKTKEEIAAKEKLFEIPAGFAPPEDVQLSLLDTSGLTVSVLRVKSTGVVESENKLTAAHFFTLGGLTYNLVPSPDLT